MMFLTRLAALLLLATTSSSAVLKQRKLQLPEGVDITAFLPLLLANGDDPETVTANALNLINTFGIELDPETLEQLPQIVESVLNNETDIDTVLEEFGPEAGIEAEVDVDVTAPEAEIPEEPEVVFVEEEPPQEPQVVPVVETEAPTSAPFEPEEPEMVDEEEPEMVDEDTTTVVVTTTEEDEDGETVAIIDTPEEDAFVTYNNGSSASELSLLGNLFATIDAISSLAGNETDFTSDLMANMNGTDEVDYNAVFGLLETFQTMVNSSEGLETLFGLNESMVESLKGSDNFTEEFDELFANFTVLLNELEDTMAEEGTEMDMAINSIVEFVTSAIQDFVIPTVPAEGDVILSDSFNLTQLIQDGVILVSQLFGPMSADGEMSDLLVLAYDLASNFAQADADSLALIVDDAPGGLYGLLTFDEMAGFEQRDATMDEAAMATKSRDDVYAFADRLSNDVDELPSSLARTVQEAEARADAQVEVSDGDDEETEPIEEEDEEDVDEVSTADGEVEVAKDANPESSAMSGFGLSSTMVVLLAGSLAMMV